MIENFNIKSISWPLPWHLWAANRLLNPYYHVQNLLAAAGSSKWHFFRDKARVELTRAKVSARVAAARAQHLFGVPTGYHHIKVADAFEHALVQYEVKPYPGELTVFMAERHLAGMGDRKHGWGEVAKGGIRVFTLPVSPRGSLVEPFVQTLAARLRECLEEAANRRMESITGQTGEHHPDSSSVSSTRESAHSDLAPVMTCQDSSLLQQITLLRTSGHPALKR
jgi:hypothetical protein